MFENILEVLNHHFRRRVCILTTVWAEEAGREVDADNAAGLSDCCQLLVGEISRMRAQSMRVGMCGDEGRMVLARLGPAVAATTSPSVTIVTDLMIIVISLLRG
jgi:hypothetical protein